MRAGLVVIATLTLAAAPKRKPLELAAWPTILIAAPLREDRLRFVTAPVLVGDAITLATAKKVVLLRPVR